MGVLEQALRNFHARDWRRDVEMLDRQLSKRGHGRAGLQHSPPSIVTGDPFALPRGNCILVIGINPAWPREERLQQIDCCRAQEEWERGFTSYRSHRRCYFAEGNGPPGKTARGDARYSQHFSRLGNAVAHALDLAPLGWDAGPVARQLFRQHAAIFDLLPYWSTDASKLDLGRVDRATQECVREWHGVIAAFVAEKLPQAIIVNNCGQRSLINRMLGCELQPVGDTGFYAGHGRCGTPILAHPFLSHWRTSNASYTANFRRAARQVGVAMPWSGNHSPASTAMRPATPWAWALAKLRPRMKSSSQERASSARRRR